MAVIIEDEFVILGIRFQRITDVFGHHYFRIRLGRRKTIFKTRIHHHH